MDWWFDSCVALDLPEPLVLEAGVRRVWARHRPPQVLLSDGSDGDGENEGRALDVVDSSTVRFCRSFVCPQH